MSGVAMLEHQDVASSSLEEAGPLDRDRYIYMGGRGVDRRIRTGAVTRHRTQMLIGPGFGSVFCPHFWESGLLRH